MTVAALLGIVSALVAWRWGRPSPQMHRMLCLVIALLWAFVLVLHLLVRQALELRQWREPAPVARVAPPAGA